MGRLRYNPCESEVAQFECLRAYIDQQVLRLDVPKEIKILKHVCVFNWSKEWSSVEKYYNCTIQRKCDQLDWVARNDRLIDLSTHLCRISFEWHQWIAWMSWNVYSRTISGSSPENIKKHTHTHTHMEG